MKRLRNRVAVIAPSSRWLAQSCRRAGFEPVAVDLFGDWDLRWCCEQVVTSSMNAGELGPLLDRFHCEGVPVWFGGGYENWGRELRRTAEGRFLNTPVASLDWCRDPARWCAGLEQAGFRVPRWKLDGGTNQGPWLVKSRTGMGGQNVRNVEVNTDCSIPDGCYLQEYIRGEDWSVVALGNGVRGVLLGCFRQLTGDRACGAPGEFHYCGNIGPLWPDSKPLLDLQYLVDQVARQAGLFGLFGIDLILANDGQQMVPIEINPRPTASGELLELATGINLFRLHCDALGGRLPVSRADGPPAGSAGMLGKAIVFNRFPDSRRIGPVLARAFQSRWAAGEIADLPVAESVVGPGEPLLTVFARGRDGDTVEKELVRLAERIQRDVQDAMQG